MLKRVDVLITLCFNTPAIQVGATLMGHKLCTTDTELDGSASCILVSKLEGVLLLYR
jgi:hypothetical protein